MSLTRTKEKMRAQIHVCTTCERIHDQKERTNGWNGWQQMKGKKELKLQHKKIAKHPKKLWRFTDANNNIHRWVFFFWLLVGLHGFIVLFSKDSLLLSCHCFYAIQIVFRTLLLSLQPISPKIYTFLVSKKQSEIDMLVNHGNHFNLFDYMPTANAE